MPLEARPPIPAEARPPIPPEGPGLYVYYRVPLARLAQTVAAVQAVQQALCAAWPGLQAELLRRADGPALASESQPGGGAGEAQRADVTLMETYRGGDMAALQAALDVAAAALPQPRHNEVFAPALLAAPRHA